MKTSLGNYSPQSYSYIQYICVILQAQSKDSSGNGARIGLLLHDIFVSLANLRHLAVLLCKTTLLGCSEAGNAVLLKCDKSSLKCFLKEGVETS